MTSDGVPFADFGLGIGCFSMVQLRRRDAVIMVIDVAITGLDVMYGIKNRSLPIIVPGDFLFFDFLNYEDKIIEGYFFNRDSYLHEFGRD